MYTQFPITGMLLESTLQDQPHWRQDTKKLWIYQWLLSWKQIRPLTSWSWAILSARTSSTSPTPNSRRNTTHNSHTRLLKCVLFSVTALPPTSQPLPAYSSQGADSLPIYILVPTKLGNSLLKHSILISLLKAAQSLVIPPWLKTAFGHFFHLCSLGGG